MNKAQLKHVNGITTNLDQQKAQIEEIRDELQDKYDNLTETVAESEKGEAMQANIDALTEAADSLSEIIEQLQSVAEAD